MLIDRPRQNESLSESGWMVNAWSNIVSHALMPELSLIELPEHNNSDQTMPGR